jgi:hypothetical protein
VVLENTNALGEEMLAGFKSLFGVVGRRTLPVTLNDLDLPRFAC